MHDPVGERLREIRKHKGLSLRTLATQANVPVSTLSEIERGKRSGENLTLGTARKLAIALGITLDHLAFRYEEELKRREPNVNIMAVSVPDSWTAGDSASVHITPIEGVNPLSMQPVSDVRIMDIQVQPQRATGRRRRET